MKLYVILAALVVAFVLPASASAYVPSKHQAKLATVASVKDRDVVQSVLSPSAAAVRSNGYLIRGVQMRRVHGGWNRPVGFVSFAKGGAPLQIVLGLIEIRSFKGGYSATFVPAS